MATEEEDIYLPMRDYDLEQMINRTLNSTSGRSMDPESYPSYFTRETREELLNEIKKEKCYKEIAKSRPDFDRKFSEIFVEIGKNKVGDSAAGRSFYSSTQDILYAVRDITPHEKDCILHSIAKKLSEKTLLDVTPEEEKEYRERTKALAKKERESVSAIVSAKTGKSIAGRRRKKTRKTKRRSRRSFY